MITSTNGSALLRPLERLLFVCADVLVWCGVVCCVLCCYDLPPNSRITGVRCLFAASRMNFATAPFPVYRILSNFDSNSLEVSETAPLITYTTHSSSNTTHQRHATHNTQHAQHTQHTTHNTQHTKTQRHIKAEHTQQYIKSRTTHTPQHQVDGGNTRHECNICMEGTHTFRIFLPLHTCAHVMSDTMYGAG